MQTPQTKRKRTILTPISNCKPTKRHLYQTPDVSSLESKPFWSFSSSKLLSRRKKIFASKKEEKKPIKNTLNLITKPQTQPNDTNIQKKALRKYKNYKLSFYNHKLTKSTLHLLKEETEKENLKSLNFSITFNLLKYLKTANLNLGHDLSPSKLTVVEVLFHKSYIFALFLNGLGVVLDRFSLACVSVLNQTYDEVIRSLYFNGIMDSIITVSVYLHENCLILHCRNISLLKLNAYESSTIFNSEILKYPGFIEFDESNDKVMTYNSVTKLYKIWDLRNYKVLYSISNVNGDTIRDIKICKNILLLIKQDNSINIINIHTCDLLKTFTNRLPIDVVDIIKHNLIMITDTQVDMNKKSSVTLINIITNMKVKVTLKEYEDDIIKSSNLIILNEQNKLVYIDYKRFKVNIYKIKNSSVKLDIKYSMNNLSIKSMISFNDRQTKLIIFNQNYDEIIILNILKQNKIKIKKKLNNINDINKLNNIFNNISFINYYKKELYIGTKNGELYKS